MYLPRFTCCLVLLRFIQSASIIEIEVWSQQDEWDLLRAVWTHTQDDATFDYLNDTSACLLRHSTPSPIQIRRDTIEWKLLLNRTQWHLQTHAEPECHHVDLWRPYFSRSSVYSRHHNDADVWVAIYHSFTVVLKGYEWTRYYGRVGVHWKSIVFCLLWHVCGVRTSAGEVLQSLYVFGVCEHIRPWRAFLLLANAVKSPVVHIWVRDSNVCHRVCPLDQNGSLVQSLGI
jgi:hypothetical protein